MAELKAYTVRMRCSKNGRRFMVQFERSRRKRLEITLVRSEEGLQAAGQSATRPDAGALSLAISDFDWTGFWCPHCGVKKSAARAFIVHCGDCGELVCGEDRCFGGA